MQKALLIGVFDRLHAGHQLLLTQIAQHNFSHVVIGVLADDLLISSHDHLHLIESQTRRCKNLEYYIKDLSQKFELVIVDKNNAESLIFDNDLTTFVGGIDQRKYLQDLNLQRQKRGLNLCKILVFDRRIRISSSSIRAHFHDIQRHSKL